MCFFLVTNRCFSGSEAVRSGLLLNAIEIYSSDRRAKRDALGIKTFRGLLMISE